MDFGRELCVVRRVRHLCAYRGALLVAPTASRIPPIAAVSLVTLAGLGAFGGHLGGAPLGRAALRVTIGGALAMAVTAAIGRVVGVAIG